MTIRFCTLFIFVISTALTGSAFAQRALGAHELILDDGLGHTLTVMPSTMTSNQIFTFPPLTSYTPGSVLFADINGAINQDNSEFFWDNTNFMLNVGNGYQIGGSTVLSNPGSTNIFCGVGAGAINLGNSSGNAFFGYNSGNENDGSGGFPDGDYNAFFGFNAGAQNTSGHANTFSGQAAGFLNQTGFDNTMIGFDAGATGSNTAGTDLTLIGSSSDAQFDNLTDATAIGSHAQIFQSYMVQLGDNQVNLVNSAGDYNSASGGYRTNGTLRVDNVGNGIFNSVSTNTLSAKIVTDNTGNYAMQPNDYAVIETGPSVAIVTLPVPVKGKIVVVKYGDNTNPSGVLLVVPHSSEKIDRLPGYDLGTIGGTDGFPSAITLISDGTDWWVTGAVTY